MVSFSRDILQMTPFGVSGGAAAHPSVSGRVISEMYLQSSAPGGTRRLFVRRPFWFH